MQEVMLQCVLLCTLSSGLLAGDKVVVTFHETARVDREVIRLGDIARIVNPSSRLVNDLIEFEVCKLDSGQHHIAINRDVVRVQLLLKGYGEDDVTVDGASECLVEYDSGVIQDDEALVSFLAKLIASRMGVLVTDLEIILNSPVMITLGNLVRDPRQLRFDPVLPSRFVPGALGINMRIWHGERLLGSRIVHLTLRKKVEVPVAQRSLEGMTALMPGDIQFESRFVGHGENKRFPVDWVGRRIVRSVESGQIVHPELIIGPGPAVTKHVVHPRDVVQVVAKSGPVRVTLQKAQALQGGGVGDTIRVKNDSTDAIIGGVITADGRVEINLD